MSVTSHDLIELVVGDTWVLDALMLDVNGDPFDLTDASIVWTLDDTRARNNVLTKSVGLGIDIIDPPAGLCTITVLPAVSATVKPGTYRDQCRVTSDDGLVATEWQGFIVVKNSNV